MKLTDALSLQCENFWGNPILANEIGLVESLIICRLIWKQDKWGDWVEHTQQDFERAIGVSPCMQRRAVGVLKAMKILEMKQIRLQHRTFYRINKEALNILEDNILERLQEAKNRGGSSSPEVRKPHLEDEVGKPNLPKLGNRTSSNVQNGSLEQEEQERENVDSDESTSLLEDSESDSPEAPEATPQAEAAAPPRRAPRMPPPRANVQESSEARRDGDPLLCPTEGLKTLPPKPRKQGESLEATVDDVINAWNEMAETCGLAQVRDSKGAVAGTIRVRLREKLFAAKWREGIELVPTEPSRYSNPPGKWHANMKWFLRPGTLGEILDEAERMQRTTATPAPGPAPAPKPKSKFPVGSPEWEKEMLSR